MQEKNINDKKNPGSKKNFSGFFIALTGLPSQSKTTGKKVFPLAGWGSFFKGVQMMGGYLKTLVGNLGELREVLKKHAWSDPTRREIEAEIAKLNKEIDELTKERVVMLP